MILNSTTIKSRTHHPWWVYLTMSGDSSFLSSILEILRFCSMARTAWMSVPGVAESASTRKMPPELRVGSEVGRNQHRSFLENCTNLKSFHIWSVRLYGEENNVGFVFW